MRTVEGCSVLDAPEFHLLHLCNCVSAEPLGLTRLIFERYPFADTYKRRPHHKSKPGTVDVLRSSWDFDDRRRVVNLYGQCYPGKPTSYETSEMREEWFRRGLDDLRGWISIKEVAVPWGIGDGDWAKYKGMLLEFEEDSGVSVVIYKP